MYGIPDDEERSRPSELPPLSTHCNSPLKFTAARTALRRPSPGQYVPRNSPAQSDWDEIRAQVRIQRVKGLDSTFHHFDLLNRFSPPISDSQRAEWKRQHTVGQQIWQINIDVLNYVGDTKLPSIMPPLDPDETALLQEWYARRCFFEEAVLVTGSSYGKPLQHWTRAAGGKVWKAELEGYTFYAGKGLFVVHSRKGVSLLSRDHLLVFSDICAERYILLLTTILDQKLGKESLSPSHLQRILINGDRILEKGGNLAYKVVYGLEASTSSRLVGEIPVGTPTGKTFQSLVYDDGRAKAVARDVLDLFEERESIIDELSVNANMLFQCYGLYRIWGHPTVEPLSGAEALKAIATNVRMLNPKEAEAITNKFKEEFVMRYFSQKKAWPELDVSNLQQNNVIRVAYENLAPPPITHPRYRRAHWGLIPFKACFPVDPKFELLEILSDKALSLPTNELYQNIKDGKGPGTSLERSVIVQWLNSNLCDPVVFLDVINRKGFPSWETSIGLREKEREGKLDARMFGLTTLLKRMYIVLTEALLAEHILPFFPEITMTDDELSLDKKRLTFTKTLKGRVHLFTSLDFSKWNSNMREAETQGVFEAFDQLFGFTRVYQRTHEMFNTSFMYLLNGSYTPKIDQNGFVPFIGSWRGHLGGIEGLRQKGWTVWTVTLILLCAEDSPIVLRLMGQGDNQVLRQTFPAHLEKHQCMEYHYKFIGRLNEMLANIGPPLKLEETWTSEDLFIYGKYVIYKGAPVETSYKRLCRMFKMSNEDFPTMESAISSMTANASSALSCSASLGSEYFIYATEIVGLLQLFFKVPFFQRTSPLRQLSQPGVIRVPRSPDIHTSKLLTHDVLSKDSFYVKMMLLPRCLGGLPISSLPQLVLRGFPDDTGLCISFLKQAYQFVPPHLAKYIARILNPRMNPSVSFELLLENPQALNLYVPSSPGEARRSSIVRFLKEEMDIKNPYFKEFIRVLDKEEDEGLVRFLESCEPCNPIVLSAIFDATAQARARKVAGKLQKTRTISKLAVDQGGIDLYDIIREAEINHLRSVVHIILSSRRGNTPWWPQTCSMDHVNALRTAGWKRQLYGLDCVSPIEFMVMETNHHDSTCDPQWELDKGFISIQLPPGMSGFDISDPLHPGPYSPYRGTATIQKVISYGSKVASFSSPLLSKAARLGALIGWATSFDSILKRVIEALLRSITDLPLEKLLPLDESISGSVHHRFEDDRVERGGAVGILPNYGSKLRLDTFPLVAYSKGSQNVNLMFQSLMSLAVVIKSTELRYSTGFNLPSTHIHVRNSCCIRPINEDLIDGKPLPVSFKSYPQNPFLFVPAEDAIPNSIKMTIFPVGAPRTHDERELVNRLVALVAYKIFNILEVPMWNRGGTSFSKPGIVINWALRLPVVRALEMVSLLLLTFFSSSAHSTTPKAFISKVAERVYRSDLDSWMGLSNLIHCPNIHHELSRPPYRTPLSGNPEMSDAVLSSNIKKCVERILFNWAKAPPEFHPLLDVEIRAPPDCGVMLHPSMCALMRSWILGEFEHDPISVRHAIVATLHCDISNKEHGYHSEVAHELIQLGSASIVPDDPDAICKRVPHPLLEVDSRPSQIRGVSLPAGHYLMSSWSRSDLTYESQSCQTHPGDSRRDYSTHAFKPLSVPTTGPYKGLSLAREALDLDPSTVGVFGDGAGGFAFSALSIFPQARVYFNTLIMSDQQIQQTPSIPYLPSLSGRPDLEQRLVGLELMNDNITDITDPRYCEMFRTKIAQSLDLVMCDAECKEYLEGVKPLHLARGIADLAYATLAKMAIFKTYALSPGTLAQQISILLSYFKTVSVLRCVLSNEINTEVYLLGCGPSNHRPIKIGEKIVEGYLLPLHLADKTYRPPLVPLQDKMVIMNAYSAFMDPAWKEIAQADLETYLPLALSQQIIKHPEDLQQWIVTTCMARRGDFKLKRAVLNTEKFSKKILTRILIQWVILYVASEPEGLQEVMAHLHLLTLYWYKGKNDKWGFCLGKWYDSRLVALGCKAWRVSSLLYSKHFKVISKMVGVMNLVGKVSFNPAHNLMGAASSYHVIPETREVITILEKMSITPWGAADASPDEPQNIP